MVGPRVFGRRAHLGYLGERGTALDDPDRLDLAVSLYRVLAAAYAAGLFVADLSEYRVVALGALVIAILLLWSLLVLVRRLLQRPSGGATVVVDLVLAAGSLLLTAVADDPARIAAAVHTLPTLWAAVPVLSWAVRWSWPGGLFAAALVVAANLAMNGGDLAGIGAHNLVLLGLLAVVVGYAAQLVRRGRAQLSAAVAAAAATAERERLARDIHDGVLQVLAYVHRNGADEPGRAGELARLAGEQEARLRALLAGARAGDDIVGDSGVTDLRQSLLGQAHDDVEVVTPAEAVLLTPQRHQAVMAAVVAALDNVRRHAGAQARSWVLLEQEGAQVTVTVRDNGCGFAADRLAAAAREGRLGVSASIQGRIAAVGGSARVTSVPGRGTEVEMSLPVAAERGAGWSA